MDDGFDIQEKVARSIADALQLKLSAEETRKPDGRPVTDVLAQECYRRARHETLFAWCLTAFPHHAACAYTILDFLYLSTYAGFMAMNIKNQEVERLAEEVAEMTGETKTEAIRKALKERRERLSYQIVRRDRKADLLRFLSREIWPAVPKRELGRTLTRKEQDQILGYGKEGV